MSIFNDRRYKILTNNERTLKWSSYKQFTLKQNVELYNVQIHDSSSRFLILQGECRTNNFTRSLHIDLFHCSPINHTNLAYLFCALVPCLCLPSPAWSLNFDSALFAVLSCNLFSKSRDAFCSSSKLDLSLGLQSSPKFALSKSATKSFSSFVSRDSLPVKVNVYSWPLGWSWVCRRPRSISLSLLVSRDQDEDKIDEDGGAGSLAFCRFVCAFFLVGTCIGIGFSFLLRFGIAGGRSGIGGGATCRINKFPDRVPPLSICTRYVLFDYYTLVV